MDRRLAELCGAIAAADDEDSNRYRARELRRATAGDSFPPRVRGYASTTIACMPEAGHVDGLHTAADTPGRVDDAALERAHGFTLDLVRLLDRDVARRR